MRIALDVRYRVESGASTYIHALAPYLIECSSGNAEFLYIRYASQATDWLPDAPTLECPMGSVLRELHWLNWTLPRELRIRRVDLYHGLKLFGPVSGSIPMVHTVHSITTERGGEFPLSRKQRAIHAYGNLVFRRSCQVIAVSKYVSDFLIEDLRIPEERVRIVHLAVADAFREAVARADPAAFDTPGLGDAPYVVCVGNIEYVKNHRTAVRALAAIRDRVPHHLVIAGRDDKPAARKLRALIARENLSDRVHLAGFMDLPTLASCLARAELLVHPSLSEGFCLAVLEGLYAGLPVVASAIPGVQDALGDTGRTIDDPNDHRAFADVMLGWLTDRPAARQDAQRRRLHADRFNWRSTARRTLEIYERCLESEGPIGSVTPELRVP